MLIKLSIIKRLPNGRYRLYSRKKDKTGKRRNLGTFNSLVAAKKREKQVQFFKYHADDQNTRDKETKALSLCSDIASYLEEAGYAEHAKNLYKTMNAIDGRLGEDDAVDSDWSETKYNITPDFVATKIKDNAQDILENNDNPFLINVADKIIKTDNAKLIDMACKHLNYDNLHSALNDIIGNFGMPVDNAEEVAVRELVKRTSEGLFGSDWNKDTIKNTQNAADFIPDAQRNIENEGTAGGLGGTGGSAGLFGIQEAEKVATKLMELANKFDKAGLFSEADVMDGLLKKATELSLEQYKEREQNRHIANTIKLIKRDYKDGKFDKMPTGHLLSSLAKRLKMNVNNSQEGGFIAGLAVAMGVIDSQDAFGDPEYYQAALGIFENPDSIEMDNIDALIGANGLDNTSVIDNQNSGMFQGLSDSYFYSNYENQEGPYMHTKITI